MAGFQAEGAVFVDGRIRCGVHPMRRAIPLDVVRRGGRIDFMVEAASNPDFTTSFTANPMGSPDTAGDAPLYTFGGIWLRTVDTEVRSLAVREDQLKTGLGRALVQACLDDARALGVRRVYALTYQRAFFEHLGFRHIERDSLPHKVWQDCIKCPHFPNCDEEAVEFLIS